MRWNPKKPGDSRFFRAVAAVLFLAVCAYGGAKLYGGLQPGTATVTARRVTLTESIPLRGIVLRREQALPQVPGATLAAEAGKRLPAGGLIAALPDGNTLRTPASAVFFPETDGYEALNPDSLDALRPDTVRALLEGEPEGEAALGRLVFGQDWYYLALTEAQPPEPGACRVQFEGYDRSLRARLVAVGPTENGETALLLRLTAGDAALLSLRKTGASLILAEHTGLSLPEEAVLQEEGGYFVYLLSPGGYERRAITLEYRQGGQLLAAEDSLEEGSIVMANANFIREKEET